MKKKILIIEDNQELVEIYKMRFDLAGFDVSASYNGLDAMVRLAEDTPDVVLLDIMMPEMNGFEVLGSIRDNLSKEKEHVPIIIWSNLSQESDKQKALDLGADVYLVKSSFSGDDLINEVKSIMEKNKA